MAQVKVITESLLSQESEKVEEVVDSSDQIEQDYDFYDDFYIKKDIEEKPEPKDRGQLIDSMLDSPILANFEAKFPGVVSTIEFALPHPKDPKYFYILRRNPYY